MPTTPFDDRLTQLVQAQQSAPIEWEKRRDSWRARVIALHDDIDQWLASVRATGVVKTIRTFDELEEQFMGRYDVPRMTIWVGEQQVILRPRGTLILGSYGRVDLEGAATQALLVLDYDGTNDIPSWRRVDQAKWCVVYPSERTVRHPLTESVFKDLLSRALGI